MSMEPQGAPSASSGRSPNDRIVEAALTLIAEKGLGGITMSAIAEAASVARQTLYNHFPDVESIVAAAISQHNRQSIALLEASLRVVDRPEDKLEQLVRHVVSIGAHANHVTGFQHGLSADTRATLDGYDEMVIQRIREVLEQGQTSGVFRLNLNPDVDAVLIHHMLNGLMAVSAGAPSDAAYIATVGTRTILAAVANS